MVVTRSRPKSVLPLHGANSVAAQWADNPNDPFPWSERLDDDNRTVFGNASFRPHQREAINASLSGKDTFVLMPTGAGKASERKGCGWNAMTCWSAAAS